jgi:ABC-2 type transport system permease protein
MTAAGIEQRPYVVGSDLRRFWSLTWMLAATDFKLRFYGSVLGYAWTLARPFLFFGVIYLVFSEIVGLDANVKNYGIYILFGLVLFQFFGETTSNCVRCLAARESLLRKMRFPRMVIPLSVALHALFNLGLNLVVVLLFVLGSGITPRPEWLELVPLVVLLVVFASGVAMLLSALYVRYRDILPIWEVSLQMLFYASPVIYVISTLPDSVERPAMANPIAAILTQARHVLIDPEAPTAAEAIGGTARLPIPLLVIVVVTALGFWVFTREAPRIAEEL